VEVADIIGRRVAESHELELDIVVVVPKPDLIVEAEFSAT